LNTETSVLISVTTEGFCKLEKRPRPLWPCCLTRFKKIEEAATQRFVRLSKKHISTTETLSYRLLTKSGDQRKHFLSVVRRRSCQLAHVILLTFLLTFLGGYVNVIYIYFNIYIYIHIHISTYTYNIYTYKLFTCIFINASLHVYTYIYIYMYIYIHTYTVYTYIYI
jgi:hypothetical protein